MKPSAEAPLPTTYRGHPYAALVVVTILLLLFREEFATSIVGVQEFDDLMYYGLITLGFYWIFALTGQFAFSQFGFVAVGAYSSAFLARHGVPVIFAIIFCTLIAGALAASFSYLMRAASEFYFAIASLGLAEIFIIIIQQWNWFSGSVGGETEGLPGLSIDGHNFSSPFQISMVFLAVFVCACLGAVVIRRSPMTRNSVAVRDNEPVAKTSGVPAVRVRVTMFALGSATAALAGALNGHANGFLSTTSYSVSLALAIFLMLIVGGMGSYWGPLLGAVFYVYIPTALSDTGLSQWQNVFFGGVLIVFMVLLPDGFIGVWHRLVGESGDRSRPPARMALDRLLTSVPVSAGSRRAGTRPRQSRRVPSVRVASEGVPERFRTLLAPGRTGKEGSSIPLSHPESSGPVPIIRVTDLTVNFGGVSAVSRVSIAVERGSVWGLIGPNGSGKSTLLNALMGLVAARGAYEVDGRSVRFGSPEMIRRLGVLRTYQTPQVYGELTCIENVLLGDSASRFLGLSGSLLRRHAMMEEERMRWRRGADALARVGLSDLSDVKGSALAYGQKRLVELARVMGAEPRVVLLDEPSAGLNTIETGVLSRHLLDLRDQGVTLLVVDHKMTFLRSICDKLGVLEQGQLIAEGEPEAVLSEERVMTAYLGVSRTSDA